MLMSHSVAYFPAACGISREGK